MNAPNRLADVMITLGARDTSRLRKFYRGLGWPQIIDDGESAAFELRGVVLAVALTAIPDFGSGGNHG